MPQHRFLEKRSGLPRFYRWRRGAAVLLLVCLAFGLAARTARGQNVPPIQLTEIVNGLVMPVGITHAGDATGRLFLVEQEGRVRIWDGSRLLPTPFLEIPVSCCGERGLLGLTFHPQYDTNGYVYVHYSNPSERAIDLHDDFQDVTTQGWTVGSPNTPFPPQLEQNSGPSGQGDHMMRLEAFGTGAGSRIAVFNEAQWGGDYTALGITEISMDLINLGVETLHIRVGFRGDGGDIVSNQAVELPENTGWTTVAFSIAPSEFTGINVDPAATLSSVSHFRIVHNPLPDFRGAEVSGNLGIDNVRATKTVPERSTMISRFRVSNDPNVVDPASELVLLTQTQPFGNHNGGQIAFGPDGYLYIGLGDGGSANDPQNHGQNSGDILGTMLRLDVPADPNDPSPRARIPATNPFVNSRGTRDEIWATGLRNPWRFSFDRSTGDLFIADVGQNAVEEINFQADGALGGRNYGWRRMEGSSCFIPSSNCNDGTLTLPVMEYPHSEGCSVTGGYRYRGRLHPTLSGIFFFGDFCQGTIWGGVEDATGVWTRAQALSTNLNISTFGEDEDGEVYIADYGSGTIHRIDIAVPPPQITAPVQGTVLEAGTNVTATGTGSNLSWQVTRLPDNLAIATATGPSVTFPVPIDSTAQQQIRVQLTGDGGNDSITYNILPAAPPLTATASANPTTGTVPLAVQFTGAGSGGAPGYTFSWAFGDGGTSAEQNPLHTYQQAGTFTATLTVQDTANATASAAVTIAVQAAPPRITAPVDGTVLDAGSTVVATGTGTNLNWRVTLAPDNIVIATAAGMASIQFMVPPGATSQHQIVVELSGDGGMDRKTYAIRAAAVPVQARATAAPTSGTAPLSVQFMGSAAGGTGAHTFAWQFGDGASSSEQNPAHIYAQAGTFNAVLTVTDTAGATASAQVAVVVRDPGAAPGITCEQVDFVWAFSRRRFECAGLGTGGLPYTDRNLSLATVPAELENTAWIRTANRDARRRSRWFLFLHTTEAVRVTVGFDAAARRLPIWLRRGWTDTGETITLDNGRVLNVFTRDYDPGWIVLGANRGPGARWQRRVRPLHYVVALAPVTVAPPSATDRFTLRRRSRR